MIVGPTVVEESSASRGRRVVLLRLREHGHHGNHHRRGVGGERVTGGDQGPHRDNRHVEGQPTADSLVVVQRVVAVVVQRLDLRDVVEVALLKV